MRLSGALFKTGSRWAVAVSAAAILAAGAAPGAASGATPASADPPPVSPAAVQAALGVGNVPAELVILIDVSQSMSPQKNGLYPVVLQKLPGFLNTLAQDEPQDTIGVIKFASSAATKVLYVGPPTSDIVLPPADDPSTYTVGTDFGFAFQRAVDLLSQAPADVKVGGVLLLSDGEPFAPGDPTYNGGRNFFDTPGWRALSNRVKALPMTVTGYDVPLTTDKTYSRNQNKALSAVFSNVQTLPNGTTDLSGALGLAQQDLLNSKVASVAAQDSGRGVQVTWSGLPRSLDLRSSGHAHVRVRLTAMTQRVPLYLTHLSLTSTGLPGPITAHLPAEETLRPGQSITLPAILTWQSHSSGVTLTGRPRLVHGRLVLSAKVSSTFTQPLKSAFDDPSFNAGRLSGAASPQFPALVPTFNILPWGVGVLVLLVLLACVLAFRALLGGTLILSSVDNFSSELRLPRRLRMSRSTENLIGIQGQMTVRGSAFRHQMRVGMRLTGRVSSEASLKPGGRAMVAGIEVIHDPDREG